MTGKDKINKQLKHKYGKLAESMVPYYEHLDLRHIDNLDDDGFEYLIAPVKGVNMLDLNETEISNASIKLLPALEYVKELRLKSCRLNDECIPYLNKITGLTLLQVKHTDITIDGLLQLTSLTDLKTVLFSSGNVDAIKDKMLQLKLMHPECDFIIDGKPYYFDNVERFMYATRSKPYAYRMKIKDWETAASWSRWIIKPGDNYYETEIQGPYPVNEIEWIEVDPVEEQKNEKLITVKLVDHTAEIVQLLETLNLPYLEVNGILRIYIVPESVT